MESPKCARVTCQVGDKNCFQIEHYVSQNQTKTTTLRLKYTPIQAPFATRGTLLILTIEATWLIVSEDIRTIRISSPIIAHFSTRRQANSLPHTIPSVFRHRRPCSTIMSLMSSWACGNDARFVFPFTTVLAWTPRTCLLSNNGFWCVRAKQKRLNSPTAQSILAKSSSKRRWH